MTGQQQQTPPGSTEPFLAYDPPVDAHAGLIAAATVLLAAATALGLHSRRLLFSGLLSAALALLILSEVGMLMLHAAPASKPAAAAAVLGSLLGPAAVCGALLTTLPGVAAVGVGPGWGFDVWRWRIGGVEIVTGLGCWVALAGILETIGAGVLVANRNGVIVVAGLIILLVNIIVFAIGSTYLSFKAARASHEDAPFSNYRGSQIKSWTAALALSTCIMVIHLIHRIFEQSQGPRGTLARSRTLSLIFVEILPLVAIAVSTVSPPSPRHPVTKIPDDDGSRTVSPMPTPMEKLSPLSPPLPALSPSPYMRAATVASSRSHLRGGSTTSTTSATRETAGMVPVVVVDLSDAAVRREKEREKRREDDAVLVNSDDLW